MTHVFPVTIQWQGNLGTGTSGTRDFSRNHVISFPDSDAPIILGSAAPEFRGDPDRHNPEQLLVASVAQCHMMTLFYLALKSGITILDYSDNAQGFLQLNDDDSGQISRVELFPTLTISADSDPAVALAMHDDVHKYCFIARSVNFPITYSVTQTVATSTEGQTL